jgi:hypothetical protein
MQAVILVMIRMLDAAAHRAGVAVDERRAQLFDAVGAGQLGQFQRAFGLGDCGIECDAGAACRVQRSFRRRAGRRGLRCLGIEFVEAPLRGAQRLFGVVELRQAFAPRVERAPFAAQGVAVDAGQRGRRLGARRFPHRLQVGRGGQRLHRAFGRGGGLYGAGTRGVQRRSAGRILARGLFGMQQALVPARPLRGEERMRTVRGQPGAGLVERAPAGIQLGRLRLQGGGGLCSLGLDGIQIAARVGLRRCQRGQRGIQRLGLVELRRRRGLDGEGGFERALGLHQAAPRLLLGVERARQIVLAGRQLGLRLAAFGGQPVQVGKQFARRLHRIERGQVAPAPGGRVDTRLRCRQRGSGLGFGAEQAHAFLVPAQALLETEAACIGLRQRGLGGAVVGVEQSARVRRQRGLVLQACREAPHRFLFQAPAFERAPRDVAIDGAAGQGFEQFAALVFIGAEEGREFVLGQQHRARKLFERQTDAPFDLAQHFGLGAAQRLQTGQLVQTHAGRLQRAAGTVARAPHAPARAITLAVVADEIDFRIGFGGAAPQQRAAVGHGQHFFADVRQVVAGARAFDEARGGVVQGQAQSVEQGALAGAGRAADREQAARRQRLALEIDFEVAGQRRQIAAADAQDLHAASRVPAPHVLAGPLSSGIISSAKAASWSSGAASPKRCCHRRRKISSGCNWAN